MAFSISLMSTLPEFIYPTLISLKALNSSLTSQCLHLENNCIVIKQSYPSTSCLKSIALDPLLSFPSLFQSQHFEINLELSASLSRHVEI